MENKKATDKYQFILVDNVKYKTFLTRKFTGRKEYEEKDPKKITAFIPGTIRKVFIKEGQKIKAGDKLLTLDAMKMNNIIASPMDGTIKTLSAKQGKIVSKNEVLIELA